MSVGWIPEDSEVVIGDGPFKGEAGVVLWNDFGRMQYYVHLTDMDDDIFFDHDEVLALDPPEFEDELEEAETPAFGMSADEFAAHLEYLVVRTLDRVPTVGAEKAFFGFQEFEAGTVEDSITLLLEKIEDGMAHLAQAHILMSRIGLAYRSITEEIASAQD